MRSCHIKLVLLIWNAILKSYLEINLSKISLDAFGLRQGYILNWPSNFIRHCGEKVLMGNRRNRWTTWAVKYSDDKDLHSMPVLIQINNS